MSKIEPPTHHLESAIAQLHEAAQAIDAAGTHIKLAAAELKQHNTNRKPDDGAEGNASDGPAGND